MKSLTMVVLLCSMSAALVWGQATAQIHGTILDASGAAVPGAVVKATRTDTGLSRTAASGADGGYVLTSLPLGPYRLEVTKQGFSTVAQTGIVLEVGSDAAIPISLKVGAVTETVEVAGATTQVETSNLGVGTVVETSQRILELPLNGRQPTDLIALGGAAVVFAVSPTYTINGGAQISVAGSYSYSIQYNLDGASHLDTWFGYNMPLPFPDALQEFRLTTSTQDASSGGHSGAAVNSVTKSGTNSFHGDAFEFFRNGNLNGRDFFAASNDHLKRNQFGGVVGGPIKRDKLFFFLGYQGTTIRQTPSNTIAFVPTPAMRAGDFSAYIANNCPEASRISRTVLSSTNQLTKPLSPAALALAAKLPVPLNACGQVLTGNPLSTNTMQAPLRIDYQLSTKQSLFARYLISRNETLPPYAITPDNLLATSGTGNDDTAQSLAIGDTYVISPNMVNSFRVFANRMGVVNTYVPFLNPGQIGVKNFVTNGLPDFMAITTLSDFNVGYTASINHVIEHFTNFGLNDDVNLVRGSHQISFGVFLMRHVLVEEGDAWIPGVFTFGGLPVNAGGTGSALADFLTGTVNNLHQYSLNPNNNTQNFVGLYVGDTWKASSRLTVNAGLRWNPFIPLSWMGGTVENFSLSRFYANQRSTVIPTAPAGFTFPGDAGFQGTSGVNSHLGYVEPRLGFAWDPFGDGKTAIRGGAGLSRDFIPTFVYQNTPGVAPFVVGLSLSGPLPFDNPYSTIPGGNPFPYTYNPKNAVFPSFPQFQGFYPFAPTLRPTVQQTWSLAVQRQVTRSLFASATYTGTHLIHTWDALELNPAIFIPGNCSAGQYGLTAPGPCSTLANVNQRRLLQLANPAGTQNLLGSMDSYDDAGTQSYNGLLLNANWRKSNVNIAGNYTWSHCRGMPYIGTSNIGSTYEHGPYQNNGPQDRYLEYGDCIASTLDIRQIANITVVAGTPTFAGAWKRRLFTGWQFGSIYTARTGPPLTLGTGADTAINGMFAASGAYPTPQRPNQLLLNTAAPNQGQSCPSAPCVMWLNSAAFATPTQGTYGNMGVANVRGPGFWEWDQAISRQFRITESQRLEVRAEGFNLTNSVRLANPATVLTSALFGKITAAQSTTGSAALTGSGGRVIQFAMKYVF